MLGTFGALVAGIVFRGLLVLPTDAQARSELEGGSSARAFCRRECRGQSAEHRPIRITAL